VLITSYNGTAAQNVSAGLVNSQSICNKSDEISDVVKDMNLGAFVITQTWVKIVGEVTPAGYSLIVQPEFTRKVGGVAIFLCDSFEVQNPFAL